MRLHKPAAPFLSLSPSLVMIPESDKKERETKSHLSHATLDIAIDGTAAHFAVEAIT